MARLRAVNLKKVYKNREVVRDVTLEVSSGQIVGLLGANGAGKTTSFYMIVGIIASNGGQVFIDDTEITSLPMHERARFGIGYLPQEASVFRRLTVEENLLGVLELNPRLGRKQRRERLEQILAEYHIEHIRKTAGMSLSGGERRRVEIARALASDPKFILLDEPFAGIDPKSVKNINDIIVGLKDRGIGVLITDHNVRETLSVCETAYIVDSGTVIASGTPDEVVKHPDVIRKYLGDDFSM
ncbi:MAG: LPS export ABC transporter ATP-binding protein [Succinivibrionaceae bacterium]|nr:LPS export ABC transporter ATP-binding protein [Succinivibrionaceae bacterium]